MKYYSEEEMKDLRLIMEKQVLDWPDTSTKKMFGSPCFLANGKLFAILVTKGVVVTRVEQNDREILSDQHQGAPFIEGRKVIQKWVRLPIETEKDLEEIIPFVRKSYEIAIQDQE